MNNTIYIIWNIKYCPSKVYEVKLGDLTSDECYLWFSIHNKKLHDNISDFEKETIRKFEKDLTSYSKYKVSDKSFSYLLNCTSDFDKLEGLFIVTGE